MRFSLPPPTCDNDYDAALQAVQCEAMMPDSSPVADISIANLIAGIFGAFVSLRFVTGSLLERFVMALGGAVMSYYATPPAARWLGMEQAEGLVGFLIGLFGMAIVAKVHETIQVLPAAQIAVQAVEALRRRLGG